MVGQLGAVQGKTVKQVKNSEDRLEMPREQGAIMEQKIHCLRRRTEIGGGEYFGK